MHALVLAGVAAPALVACGPPPPAITVVEVDGVGTFTQPLDIDEDGTVVGWSRAAPVPDDWYLWPAEGRPFRWEDGVTTPLPATPEGGVASGVDGDRVTGWVWGSGGPDGGSSEAQAVVWEDGVRTDIAPSLSLPTRGRRVAGDVVLVEIDWTVVQGAAVWDGTTLTNASGVNAAIRPGDLNSSGMVAGSTPRYPDQPYVWTPTTGMIGTGTLGGEFGDTEAVNEAGQVAGRSDTGEQGPSGPLQRAFLWEDGELTDLGHLGGGESAVRGHGALSESGHVVGTSTRADGRRHGFLWHEGTMTDLGTLGGEWSQPEAVNAHGQVVGESPTADGARHVFLWSDGEMTDLTALAPGVTQVVDINDDGQVIGFDPAGGRAVVWQVPTPG